MTPLRRNVVAFANLRAVQKCFTERKYRTSLIIPELRELPSETRFSFVRWYLKFSSHLYSAPFETVVCKHSEYLSIFPIHSARRIFQYDRFQVNFMQWKIPRSERFGFEEKIIKNVCEFFFFLCVLLKIYHVSPVISSKLVVEMKFLSRFHFYSKVDTA